MPVRRYLLFIWLVIHLGLAARLNSASAGLWAFQLSEGSALTHYARLTGLICTYGFFSPRVASPCFLEIGLAAPGRNSEVRPHYLSFASHEARLRFHSFSTIFLDLAPTARDGFARTDTLLAGRMAKAFARSVAEREAQRLGKQLRYFRILVYRHPQLAAYGGETTGTLNYLYVYQTDP
ncbi:MAG TPA: hypothetical protein VNQ55_02340 [Parapedobacter sp.]|nr:hypothetical protein [Parapedobacter sp.]